MTSELSPFFEAMAGGGAALMGVLFVAASFQAERLSDSSNRPELESMADASLMSLFDGFILSLVPNFNPGVAAMPLSALALVTVAMVTLRVLSRGAYTKWSLRLKVLAPTMASVAVAGFQVYVGFRLLVKPEDPRAMTYLAGVVMGAYSIGLARSWMLLGGARYGLRSAVRDFQQDPPRDPDPDLAPTLSSASTSRRH
jgi:hypothetical protein